MRHEAWVLPDYVLKVRIPYDPIEKLVTHKDVVVKGDVATHWRSW